MNIYTLFELKTMALIFELDTFFSHQYLIYLLLEQARYPLHQQLWKNFQNKLTKTFNNLENEKNTYSYIIVKDFMSHSIYVQPVTLLQSSACNLWI